MIDKNTMDSDDDPENDDRLYPLSPKWPRAVEYSLLAEAVLAYAAIVRYADDVRTTYQQAINSDDTKERVKDMVAEFKARSENGSWRLAMKMKEIIPIGFRWVFSKKRNDHVHVVRYKARLVTKGLKQKFGFDFFMNFIQVVLSVVVANGYLAEQIDTDTEFLTASSRNEYTRMCLWYFTRQ